MIRFMGNQQTAIHFTTTEIVAANPLFDSLFLQSTVVDESNAVITLWYNEPEWVRLERDRSKLIAQQQIALMNTK